MVNSYYYELEKVIVSSQLLLDALVPIETVSCASAGSEIYAVYSLCGCQKKLYVNTHVRFCCWIKTCFLNVMRLVLYAQNTCF